jgi:major membrane immunogen (membrane-anchored lipoprotein)
MEIRENTMNIKVLDADAAREVVKKQLQTMTNGLREVVKALQEGNAAKAVELFPDEYTPVIYDNLKQVALMESAKPGGSNAPAAKKAPAKPAPEVKK